MRQAPYATRSRPSPTRRIESCPAAGGADEEPASGRRGEPRAAGRLVTESPEADRHGEPTTKKRYGHGDNEDVEAVGWRGGPRRRRSDLRRCPRRYDQRERRGSRYDGDVGERVGRRAA